MKIDIPLINLSWHGGVRVLVQLANHLSLAGHDVEIVVARGYVTGNYELTPGVSLKYVGPKTGIKLLDYLSFLFLLPFVLRRKSLIIANFFITYYPVILGAWLKRGMHVYLVQDIESKYTGALGAVLNAVCRRTYRDLYIITVSRFLKDRLHREFGVESQYVDIGPADVFYELPQATEVQARYDVAFFARREPWKGLDRLLELRRRYPNSWSLICISQDQDLLSELRAQGLSCVCPKDDTALVRILDASQILLFTSYDEGFGLPPLEAMARGVPTVLYPCRGPDLYVEHERNAIYVNSVEDCQQRILQLLTDAGLRQNLSAAGRLTAEQFRMSSALNRIQEFIEQQVRPEARHE